MAGGTSAAKLSSPSCERARSDVCGLQEVWVDPKDNLAASIAEELGMHHAYAPSPASGKWQRKIGDASVGVGDAVLSRWPISESEVRRLPAGDEPDEGRTALHAPHEAPRCAGSAALSPRRAGNTARLGADKSLRVSGSNR